MGLEISVAPNPADPIILEGHNCQRFNKSPCHNISLDYRVAIMTDGCKPVARNGASHNDLLMHEPVRMAVESLPRSLLLALGLIFAFLLIVAVPRPALAATGSSHQARLFIIMVWDGLRPDTVTPAATPNLYALKSQGSYFAAHHAIYPSLTMVNAAALATAAPPGANGIIGNKMYFAPLLDDRAPQSGAALARARTMPVSLENSAMLAALGGPGALNGNLVEVETIAQQLLRKCGFVGIVGKTGPTFLFDDRAGAQHCDTDANEIFVSDDQVVPPSLAQQLGPGLSRAALTAALARTPPLGDQDAHLADVFIDRVLPPAAAAVTANRPAFLLFWQHNPDITQHAAGLGTAAFDRALGICDANLGRLRAALVKLHVEDRTDLVIVSDHGFATIKERVDLAGLLVAHGLKQSKTSDDVVVANNFGSDEIYLSPRMAPAVRAGLMRKIVDYAAAQPWCGPIFSRAVSAVADHGYAGEIPGTFDQAWFGLLNPARSADLIISFRESAGEDNSKLTGPQAAALVLDSSGMHSEPNKSQPLVHRVLGTSYADSGLLVTTGGGTHGALGEDDMHNFGAATGPDFRRAYIDKAPTSNIDVARTAAALLGIQNDGGTARKPFAAGRLLKEALRNGPPPGPYHRVPLSVTLNLPGQQIVTTVEVDRIGGEVYPIDAKVVQIPAGVKH